MKIDTVVSEKGKGKGMRKGEREGDEGNRRKGG